MKTYCKPTICVVDFEVTDVICCSDDSLTLDSDDGLTISDEGGTGGALGRERSNPIWDE